jgi:cell wall-associated NlpC family hydrolase
MDFAERARALVGTPFRPQGRGVDGFDCVGVAVDVFAISGVPQNYRLRGAHADEIGEFLSRHFRPVPAIRARPGDLLLMRIAEDQVHFGVSTPAGFVHAHAGVRRVVETPGAPGWPVLGVYRRRKDQEWRP